MAKRAAQKHRKGTASGIREWVKRHQASLPDDPAERKKEIERRKAISKGAKLSSDELELQKARRTRTIAPNKRRSHGNRSQQRSKAIGEQR